jgi:hypothetical protein
MLLAIASATGIIIFGFTQDYRRVKEWEFVSNEYGCGGYCVELVHKDEEGKTISNFCVCAVPSEQRARYVAKTCNEIFD